MNSNFFKGLISAVLGALVALYAIPGATPIIYAVMAFASILIYTGTNLILPVYNIFGTINGSDILKGLIFTVGTAISTYIAGLIQNHVFIPNLNVLWQAVYSALILYLGHAFTQNVTGGFGKEIKEAIKQGRFAVKFGKHPARKYNKDVLKLEKYFLTLPTAKIAIDNMAPTFVVNGSNDPAVVFPMDGNDTLGDCVVAGWGHILTVLLALIGKAFITPAKDIVNLYNKLTGNVDSGLNEVDFLKYNKAHKFDKQEILCFVTVDPSNQELIKIGIELFGGAYFGMNVQENAISDFQNKIPWTPGTLTNDGHCVISAKYDPTYIYIITWGGFIPATWAWATECLDEVHFVILKSWQGAPGFDMRTLREDIAVMGKVTHPYQTWSSLLLRAIKNFFITIFK